MATLAATSSGAPAANGQPAKYPTRYRTIAIDGVSIFYREAGPKDGPTILLLHGLPIIFAHVRVFIRSTRPIVTIW